MNNWLKIGLPVLMAVLLIFAAVAVMMAVTALGPSARAEAASYGAPDNYSQQLGCSGNCGNCAGNANCNGNGNCCRYR